MTQVHQCRDNTELVSLYPSRGLYLKPISRINVSVHYPELKQSLTTGGKSVSSWDIMSRVKALVAPEEFISLRVVKNTLEFIRFEGDLQNRDVLKKILSRLDGKTMKVTGFKEALKIRAAESKLQFPSKYDWDTFFRDAKNMNEMKGGERPDTIHFQNIPSKWFSDDRTSDKPLPSEKIFRRVMESFGEVRCVDIPLCDPYRSQITKTIGGINTFTAFTNDNVFEGYVQYRDYMSFVKAMDALRGSFLFYEETSAGKYWVANLKVDFDKSKHMSDESIRRRKFERDKLTEKDKQKKTAEKLSRIEALVIEKKNQEKEKKETDKNLAKIEYKIEMEERKYLIARRKLEAIRLMDYLFETIKRKVEAKKVKKKKLKERTKEETKKFERAMKKYSGNDEENERRSASKSRSRSRSHDENRMDRENSDEEEKSDRMTRRRHSPQNRHQDYHTDSNRDRIHGEGRISGDTRYLGDWEVKARSNLGSEVKVNPNYVPVGVRGHPYPFRGQRGGRFFRGGDRGSFRGGFRGRGGYPPHFYPPQGYYNDDNGPPPPFPHANPRHYSERRFEGEWRAPFIHKRRRDDYEERGPLQVETDRPSSSSRGQRERTGSPSEQKISSSRGQREKSASDQKNEREGSPRSGERRDSDGNILVLHNFSYLEELDRAYEKYFTSITNRHQD